MIYWFHCSETTRVHCLNCLIRFSYSNELCVRKPRVRYTLPNFKCPASIILRTIHFSTGHLIKHLNFISPPPLFLLLFSSFLAYFFVLIFPKIYIAFDRWVAADSLEIMGKFRWEIPTILLHTFSHKKLQHFAVDPTKESFCVPYRKSV